MREDPVPPPQDALERVRVLQARLAARLLADMGDRQQRLDGVLPDEVGHRALAGRLRLEEAARELPLVERQTPSVRVGSGFAAAEGEPGEGEGDVGGDVALHPQQLTHAPIVLKIGATHARPFNRVAGVSGAPLVGDAAWGGRHRGAGGDRGVRPRARERVHLRRGDGPPRRAAIPAVGRVRQAGLEELLRRQPRGDLAAVLYAHLHARRDGVFSCRRCSRRTACSGTSWRPSC